MGLFSFFQPKDALKRKIQIIEEEIKNILSIHLDEKFSVFHYGAYDIDPKHLVFWVCVNTDEIKEKLEKDQNLNKGLKDTLYKNKYPKKAISSIHIRFESQETVDRESNGNWWIHFK